MKCDEILELLPLYLEDMLDSAEKKSVEEHLETCASCEKELEFLESIRSEMNEMPEIEPSAEFTSKLHEKLLLEKQVKKAPLILPKRWKSYFTVAASAAVIAISVVALNTEFYKIDESILGGEVNNISENLAETSDVAEDTQINQEKQLQEDVFAGRTADGKKAETSEFVDRSAPKAEAGAIYDMTKSAEPAKEEQAAEERSAEDVIAPASEMTADTSMAAFTPDDAQEGAERDKSLQETAEEQESNKLSSGGGSSVARSFKLAPSYDKIVFIITIPDGNESLMERFSNISKEGEEYKLPLEEFYELTSELLAIPDSTGYYTTENMTDEYNELSEKLHDETAEDIDFVKERISEIEEICKFGYIVIE